MSKSLTITAESASLNANQSGGMTVRITNPSEADLTKLIRDAARLLHFQLERKRIEKRA